MIAIAFALLVNPGSAEAWQASMNLSDQSLTGAQQPDFGSQRNWQTDAMRMMQHQPAMTSSPAAFQDPRGAMSSTQSVATQAAFQQPADANSIKLPPIGTANPNVAPQASFLPPVHAAPPKKAGQESGIYVQPEMQVHRNQQQRPGMARQTNYSEPARKVVQVAQQPTLAAPKASYGQQQVAMPPINAKPRLQGSYIKKNDSLSKFRNIQLSSESLIHRRGPGLQDRIANALAKARASVPVVDQIPVVDEFVSTSPQRSTARQRSATRQVANHGSARVSAKSPTRRSQNARAYYAQATNQELTNQRTVPAEQPVQIAAVEHPAKRRVRQQRSVDDSRITQAAMTNEPVAPAQDPFGDYPPLRSDEVDAPPEPEFRVASTQDGPVSILNRPARDNSSASQSLRNQPLRRQSVNTFSQPQFDYAPGIQDNDVGGDFAAEPTTQELPEPTANELGDAFDALESEFGDSSDTQSQLDEMEELPGESEEIDLGDEDNDDFDKDIENLEDDIDDELGDKPIGKNCQEFRDQLLNNPITSISLDISPPRSNLQTEYTLLSRSWTDHRGNILATGTMKSLSRGYVILESGEKIPYARLSDADLAAISEFWKIPDECTIGNTGFAGRNWVPQTFTWKASSLCHKPLFFENIQLERYGHSHGPFLQPVQSVAHFFTSLVTLPYQTSIHPPNECQYALGYYRPGNCAPWLKDPIPISLDGFKRQLEISTGMAFIP